MEKQMLGASSPVDSATPVNGFQVSAAMDDHDPTELDLDRNPTYFGESVINLSKRLTEVNFRLLAFLFPATICVCGANRSNFFGETIGQSKTTAIFFIISNIIFIIGCTFLIGTAMVEYVKPRNELRYADCLYKLLNPDYYRSDLKKLKIFLFSSESTFVLLNVVLLLYSSIGELIINVVLFSYNFDENCLDILGADEDDGNAWTLYDINNRSGCALEVSTYASTYGFAICVVCMALVAQPSSDCKEEILNGQTSLFKKSIYKESKLREDAEIYNHKFYTLEEVNTNILETLKKWEKKTFKWSAHPYQTAFLFCFSFGYHIGTVLFRVNGLFEENKYGMGYICIIFVFIIFDSICVGIALIGATRFCYHYEYPSIIMNAMVPKLDELENRFNINSAESMDFVNSMIGWWLLRRNYIFAIIHTYAISFDKFISASLIGSIISSLLYVFDDSQFDRKMLFLFGTVFIIIINFIFATNGVSYLKAQREHLRMITHLKLLLDRKQLDLISSGDDDAIGNSDKSIGLIMSIIDNISNDMKSNQYAFRVLGFKLDDAFMAALTTAVGGFAINAIIQFMLSN